MVPHCNRVEGPDVSGEIGWKFPFLNDGTREGFNVPAIDMFKSERLQALVREMIQNSLDARNHSEAPVEVRFTLDDITDLEATGFEELARYFTVARDLERTDAGKRFYDRAREQIDDGVVKILGVHDYNTKGLTGPTYDPPSEPATGPWLALVKGAGMTFKDSNAALGSFGHGSRAPFAMSELRTLFYLTRIRDGGATETRFQGKSILQSVPLTSITGDDQWSVATGYFGIRDKCRPLIDASVPAWAVEARPEPSDVPSIGTSIFIPEPYGVDEAELLWAQVKLAVVANFYYAVLRGKLVVHLGHDEAIDASTIAQAFDDVVETHLLEELNPTDRVRDRLESARTIRHPEQHETIDLEGFGSISWYLRLEDMRSRKVGIARGNGMLITRAAERLQRFPGLRNFDLFVCVTGDAGSELLRKLENPEHTEFSFDRISDRHERRAAESAYGRFVDAIRGLLREHASIESDDEVTVSDLDDLFRVDAGDGGGAGDAGEPTRTLRVRTRRVRTHRENRETQLSPGGEDAPGGSGGGSTGAGGSGRVAPEGGAKGGGGGKTGLPVRNLRVVRDHPGSAVANVGFSPVDGSRSRLVLLRSGDSEVGRLRFRVHGESEWVESLQLVDLSPTARKVLRLEFEPGDLEYAIEGRLEP